MKTNRSLYEIEIALAKHPDFSFKRNIVVFNVNGISGRLPIFHECDMLVCSKSGYLTEIEIKRSWTDFVADFNKKHKHESEGMIKYFYYCLPESFDLEKTYQIIEKNGIQYSGIYFYDKSLHFQFHGYRLDLGNRLIYVNRALEKFSKLYLEQQLELARLGAMRVVGLKEKLVKTILASNGKAGER